MKKGSPEGAPLPKGLRPFGRGLGCPPDINYTPSVEGSFLVRKGVRGMVERIFQQPARADGITLNKS